MDPQRVRRDGDRELLFTRTGPLRINMRVYNMQNQQDPLYYIDIDGSFGDDTDLTLHSGADKHGPSFGSCHFNKFRTSQIQISPRLLPNCTMILSHEQGYRWSMPWVNFPGDSDPKAERHFIWRDKQPTRPASLGSGKLELELCSTDSPDAHAVYDGAAPGTRKGGVLHLKDDLGEEWRTMVVLTLSPLIEKARQKRARGGSFTIGMLAY